MTVLDESESRQTATRTKNAFCIASASEPTQFLPSRNMSQSEDSAQVAGNDVAEVQAPAPKQYPPVILHGVLAVLVEHSMLHWISAAAISYSRGS